MKSNDWRHKNVARYTPGNTKILYFFNCLLDGMHTISPFCTNSKEQLLTEPTIERTEKIFLVPLYIPISYSFKICPIYKIFSYFHWNVQLSIYMVSQDNAKLNIWHFLICEAKLMFSKGSRAIEPLYALFPNHTNTGAETVYFIHSPKQHIFPSSIQAF